MRAFLSALPIMGGYLTILVLVLIGTATGAVDRTLNATINPNCPVGDCDFGTDAPYKNNLVYIRSENLANNMSDPRQYRLFWSTIGAPTVLITEVSPSANKEIDLDWTNFMADNKPEPPFLSLYGGRYAGLGFSKLIEYDDVNNTGQIYDAVTTLTYQLKDARWFNVSLDSMSAGDGSLIGKFQASLMDPANMPALFNITIELRAHTGDGRAEQYPRMLFTLSSVTVRLILDKIPVHFNHSRFALEIMFASNDSSMAPATHTKDKSISDEYSPGIFTVERVGGSDTFIQWRPVVYTKTNPGVSDSTRSQTGDLVNITNIVDRNVTGWGMPYSLLQGINGIQNGGTTLVRFNVSFGITDDDFYNSTQYQEWTCEIGVGHPPIETVSNDINLIIGVGVGIPAALILLGGIYVGYLRFKKRRESRLSGLGQSSVSGTNYQTMPS